MAQGIQIFDASGQIVLDTPDLVTRLVLTMNVTVDGSTVLPFPAGTRFAAYIVAGGFTNRASTVPTVYVNGLTVSWELFNFSTMNNTLVILRY